jgi:hypothetical protein
VASTNSEAAQVAGYMQWPDYRRWLQPSHKDQIVGVAQVVWWWYQQFGLHHDFSQ